MSPLPKLGMIPLLIALAAAAPSPKPANIVIAVSKDGSVKITRDGKTINCEQLRRQTFHASRNDHRSKPLNCKLFPRHAVSN